jgi:hypothetical protein
MAYITCGVLNMTDVPAPSTASAVGAHVGVTPTKATAGAGVTGSARVTPHKGAGGLYSRYTIYHM